MPISAEILIVDDDLDIRDMLCVVLKAAGYAVRTASDGSGAMKQIADRKPDLMVLDIMMHTDTEGFDLMYQLQESTETANIPIIVMTSFLGKVGSDGVGGFDYIMGERWGASWIFEKPVDHKKLLRQIEAILNEKSERREEQ